MQQFFIKLIAIIILLNNMCMNANIFQLEFQNTRENINIPPLERGSLNIAEFHWQGKIPENTAKYIHVNYNSKQVISGSTKRTSAWDMNLIAKTKWISNICTIFTADSIQESDTPTDTYTLRNAFSSMRIIKTELATKFATKQYSHFLCRSKIKLSLASDDIDGRPTHVISLLEHEQRIPQQCLWLAIRDTENIDSFAITKFVPVRAFALRHNSLGILRESLNVRAHMEQGEEFILVDCHALSKFSSHLSSAVPWTIRYYNLNSKKKKLSHFLTGNLWEINFEYNWIDSSKKVDERRGVWRSNKLVVQKSSANMDDFLYTITNANEWQYFKFSKRKYYAPPNSMILCSEKIGNGPLKYLVKFYPIADELIDACCKWIKNTVTTISGNYFSVEYYRIAECDKKTNV